MANPFKDWNEITADEHNRRVAACKKVPAVLMTLTLTGKCKGCGKKISKDAEFCTSCIAPPKRKPLINKTEARFLARLKAENPGQYIGCQNITFLLARDLRYTPDFWLAPPGGRMVFWEVKGAFIREDGLIKLKTAAAMFPMFHFVLAQWKDGQWTIKTIPAL